MRRVTKKTTAFYERGQTAYSFKQALRLVKGAKNRSKERSYWGPNWVEKEWLFVYNEKENGLFLVHINSTEEVNDEKEAIDTVASKQAEDTTEKSYTFEDGV